MIRAVRLLLLPLALAGCAPRPFINAADDAQQQTDCRALLCWRELRGTRVIQLWLETLTDQPITLVYRMTTTNMGGAAAARRFVIKKKTRRRLATLRIPPRGALVDLGERVSAGQHIGWSGNSGRSDRPHLHFHVSTPLLTGPQAFKTFPIRFQGVNGKPLRVAKNRRYRAP